MGTLGGLPEDAATIPAVHFQFEQAMSSTFRSFPFVAAALCFFVSTACSDSKSKTIDNSADSGASSADSGAAPLGCLTGKAFPLDLADARIIKPQGIGPIVADALGAAWSFGVSAETDTTVTTLIASNIRGAQDMCTPTAHPPEGSWNDPVFAVGPADLVLYRDIFTITLSNFQFTAAANAECSAIQDGVFQADLDARLPGLDDLTGISDPQVICDALLGLGTECEACDSDGEPYCLKLMVDQMDAAASDGALVEVTAEDIAANTDCGG